VGGGQEYPSGPTKQGERVWEKNDREKGSVYVARKVRVTRNKKLDSNGVPLHWACVKGTSLKEENRNDFPKDKGRPGTRKRKPAEDARERLKRGKRDSKSIDTPACREAKKKSNQSHLGELIFWAC